MTNKKDHEGSQVSAWEDANNLKIPDINQKNHLQASKRSVVSQKLAKSPKTSNTKTRSKRPLDTLQMDVQRMELEKRATSTIRNYNIESKKKRNFMSKTGVNWLYDGNITMLAGEDGDSSAITR